VSIAVATQGLALALVAKIQINIRVATRPSMWGRLMANTAFIAVAIRGLVAELALMRRLDITS